LILLSITLKRGSRVDRWLALCLATLIAAIAGAQDKPYFVTYSHDLEEPGNLEVETKTALAQARWRQPLRSHCNGVRIRHARLVDHRALSRRPGHRKRFDGIHRLGDWRIAFGR
jgi:hypothetical protein